MTPQQLEILALLYEAYGEGDFVFQGKQGSAVQMVYGKFGDNPYRKLLGGQTTRTNFKGEFVLWNVLINTNFVLQVRKDTYKDKQIIYYRLSQEGATVGRLLCSKDAANVKIAQDICKNYAGTEEELPASHYKEQMEIAQERVYFLEKKIRESREFLRWMKKNLEPMMSEMSKKFDEYKV